MGGAASADRTHYTPDELREFVGDDLGEELEAFIALAATDDGDGPMIAHVDIVNFIHGIPLDASMRTSRVVRVDGLIALLPAAELAAGVRAGKKATDMKREAEFAQSRRYKDGDEVIRKAEGSKPEYTVECFLARGGFGDVYKVVAILKQKEDEEKRDDRSFAMKVIRLEGKDRDARARALRSLVEETHFALRVRRVAGGCSAARAPSARDASFFAPPPSTARRAPEPRRAARLLRDPATRRARAVQCHQRVYRRQARPASLHV